MQPPKDLLCSKRREPEILNEDLELLSRQSAKIYCLSSHSLKKNATSTFAVSGASLP